jgi:OOP family OmpA-OmpF porin
MPLRPALPFRFLILTAAMLATGIAGADTAREGYTQYGAAEIVHDGFAGCVRSGQWTEQNVLRECGGAAMPRPERTGSLVPAPPPAPVVAEPLAESAPAEIMPVAYTVPVEPPARPLPVVETVTLGPETLFDLDKYNIRPAGKAELDDLAARIRNKPVKSIDVGGHADRTGPAALNRRLSERRAQSVKNYLVMKGVPEGTITARGFGTSVPRMTADECAGMPSKELATCLQPDRRVEIALNR